MAASDSETSLSSEKRESLVCPLCLDVFKDPKLLSCSHSFCEKCLEDLIQRHTDGSFPCPSCRKDIEIPAEGPSAFQSNHYITADELEKARNETEALCSLHPKKNLSMFCIECDALICMDCKLGHHLHHKSQSLQDASQEAKGQLSKDKERIKIVVEGLEKKVAERSQDQSEFKEKKAAVEQEIRQRHSAVVEAADKYRDEALATVNKKCKKIEESQSTALDTAQKNLEAVHKLQQSIDKAIESGEDHQLVRVAKEMRAGHGSQKSVDKLAVEPLKVMSRPVYLGETPRDDAMFTSMKKFIGTGKLVQLSSSSASEVRVREEFKCGKEMDAAPFCICPLDGGTLISFDWQYNRKEMCLVQVSSEGKEIFSESSADAFASMRRGFDGKMIGYSNKTEFSHTLVKCSSKEHCWLRSSGQGIAQFARFRVVTYEPFKTNEYGKFHIECNHHRAVDIDAAETVLVVVEEGNNVGDSRQVKLFQPGRRTTLHTFSSTYTSPVSPYQPADVCFFTLGTEEVYVVWDFVAPHDNFFFYECNISHVNRVQYVFKNCMN